MELKKAFDTLLSRVTKMPCRDHGFGSDVFALIRIRFQYLNPDPRHTSAQKILENIIRGPSKNEKGNNFLLKNVKKQLFHKRENSNPVFSWIRSREKYGPGSGLSRKVGSGSEILAETIEDYLHYILNCSSCIFDPAQLS